MMTPSKYDDLLTLLCHGWPALRQWLADNGKGTQDLWRDALLPLEYDDCHEAVHRIFSGHAERPEGFSNFPAVLRRVAAAVGSERRQATQPAAVPAPTMSKEEAAATKQWAAEMIESLAENTTLGKKGQRALRDFRRRARQQAAAAGPLPKLGGETDG
jgi:hypothetical protein